MKEIVKIFALGGLDENGKNLYVVDINEDLYIFDAGIRYPEESLLGIDIILPGINYLFENRHRIKAFFISHGHDENMGAIPFLCEEIQAPVFATKLTIALIKDAAKRYKKEEVNIPFVEIKRDETIHVDDKTIYAFAVTHGSSEAVGYALETKHGLIVYSGDYILDFSADEPYRSDFNRISYLSTKPTLCLLTDSYNSTYKGMVSPNHKIYHRLCQIMEDVKGRIFISLYGQNLFGLQEIIAATIKSKRKLLLYTDYSKNILDTLQGLYENPFIDEKNISTNPLEVNSVILVMDLGSKVFETLTKIAESNENEDSLKITEEDAFILASPPHTGTELMYAKILDKLYRTNAQIFNISSKEMVSMHAGSQDLKMLLSILKPKYYMPIRGYYIKMIENAKLAVDLGYNHNNILVYDNGMVANFEDGVLIRSHESVECKEIMVDGIGIGDVGSVVINDRRKLSSDGVMILGISFSMSTRKIVAGPDIQMRGLIFLKDANEIVNKISGIFEKTVFDYVQKPGLVDFNELRNICKENISRVVRSDLGKDPMILPVIISV